MPRFEVEVLGPTAVLVDGRRADLRPREASVAAALALTRAPTTTETLIDLLWTVPPRSATKTVQNHIARLRRSADVVSTEPGGYRLLPAANLDRELLESLTSAGGADPETADPLARLLAAWHGPAFASLGSHPAVEAERARLHELRLQADERVLALRLLRDGDSARSATATAEELAAAEPYREHRWWLLMLARHRGGRRRDALDAYQQARDVLIEGAGMEPGEALRILEARILADDPVLMTDLALMAPEGPFAAPTSPASAVHGPQRRSPEPSPDAPPHERLTLQIAAIHGPDVALDACHRAAEEAFEQFAYQEAADLRSTVRDLIEQSGGPGGPEATDAAIGVGEALHLAGSAEGASLLLDVSERAEAAGDLDRAARALLCSFRLGPGTDAGSPDPDLGRRARRVLAGRLRPDVAAELAGAASLLHSLDPDPTLCRDLFDRAETLARAEAPHVLPRVLPFAFLGVAHPDQLERRAAIAEELVAIAPDPGARFSGLHQRFSVQVQTGDPGFRDTHEEMIALARRMGDPGHRWTVAYNTACVEHLAGDHDAAESQADRAAAIEGISPSRRAAAWAVQIVALRRAQGRLAELRDPVEALMREQPEVAGWRAVALAAWAADGDVDRVAQLSDTIASDGHSGVPDDYTRSGAALLVVEAVIATGDRHRIARDLPLLDRLRGRMSWVGSTTLGSIDLVAGRAELALGDRGAAIASFTGALELGRRMGSPPVVARASEALAAASG